MALLLAPYTNAMRLGQGFNSYTQQICVDDAVVIDPNRAENIITNDGTTMRIAAELTGKPSAWHRIKEVVKEGPLIDEIAAEDSGESTPAAKIPAKAAAGAIEAPVASEVASGGETPELEGEASATPETEEATGSSDENEAKGVSSENDSVLNVVPEDAEDVADEGTAAETSTSATTASKSARTPAPSGNKKASKPFALKPSHKYYVAEVPVRHSAGKGAVAHQQLDEVALEEAKLEKAERLEKIQEEKRRMAEQRAYQREVDLERRKEQTVIRHEEAKEQSEIRAEKRAIEKARREAAQKAIENAVQAHGNALTLEELNKIKEQNQFVDRFEGMVKEDKKYYFDPATGQGVSQTVTYSSRFIDKLSDITEDMCISGALSVKMAKIGGSGRGSFVDSDKFKESDLSFYISVKVVNQTVNFKDALEFNKLRSVDISSADEFNKVYGDSFISGFVEGGEFNAVVSMKVHNKAKLLDIKAEAKVALTTGPVDIKAEANVGIARTNLEMNTETTIQVSWCGGGIIKPMDQPWNIESIMEAAARFPELVSHCPQRTYAILTKYDTLRSFVALRPAKYSPLQYENAQLYTNVLMDAFMTYKSIYKRLGDQCLSIQNKTLEFEAVDAAQAELDKTAAIAAAAKPTPKMEELMNKIKAGHPQAAECQQYLTALRSVADISSFEASMKGLSEARKFIRRQMVYIVNEVDLIEKDPKIATDQDHEEPFQSPMMFEDRLPATKIPDRLKPKTDPLGGRRIMAKTQTEAELEEEQRRQEEEDASCPPIYTADDDLDNEEATLLDKIAEKNPGIGRDLQVSKAVPKVEKPEGTAMFNNLDFLFPEWQVEQINIGLAMGRVVSVEIKYDNGLILQKGITFPAQNAPVVKTKTLKDFQVGERITSVAIEFGELTAGDVPAESAKRVLSICMYTTRGRRLLGQAVQNEVKSNRVVIKDGVEYKNTQTTFLDAAFSFGTLKGFFGRLDRNAQTGGFLRVGVVWGRITGSASEMGSFNTTVDEPAPIYDIDESSAAATIETIRGQTRAAEDQARNVRSELAAAQERERQLAERKAQLEEAMRNINQEKERCSQQANVAESQRRDAENRLDMDRKIIVGTINYGGRDFMFNKKIHDKVRNYVLNRGAISLSNDFFEEDPAPGVHKGGQVSVWHADKGLQTLAGGENTSRVFF